MAQRANIRIICGIQTSDQQQGAVAGGSPSPLVIGVEVCSISAGPAEPPTRIRMAQAAAVAILEFINKSGSSPYSTSVGSYMIHIIKPAISACTVTTTACHLAARRVLRWRA